MRMPSTFKIFQKVFLHWLYCMQNWNLNRKRTSRGSVINPLELYFVSTRPSPIASTTTTTCCVEFELQVNNLRLLDWEYMMICQVVVVQRRIDATRSSSATSGSLFIISRLRSIIMNHIAAVFTISLAGTIPFVYIKYTYIYKYTIIMLVFNPTYWILYITFGLSE